MTDKRILFGDFEFPRTNGLKYLLNEELLVTDYLFVNESHDSFSMYFENGFPIFTVPENSERPYCLFEMKCSDRRIKFFCPEKHPNLDSVVWYFYVEVFDEQGVAHGLPGQISLSIPPNAADDATCIESAPHSIPASPSSMPMLSAALELIG